VEKLDSWLGYVKTAGPGGYSDVTNPAVCDYPFKVLFVGWTGQVQICCTDTVERELTLGTIKQKSDVAAIWNSPLLEELRIRHNNLDCEGIDPCSRCGRTVGYVKR
jgi:hypothetical protein